MRIQDSIVSVVLCLAAAVVRAGSPDGAVDPSDPERQQAFQLYHEHKMPEAALLLEKVISKAPTDMAAHAALGAALVGRAAAETDAEKARSDLLYARKELLRAKELGDTSDLSRTLLAQIPESGNIPPRSAKPEVDADLKAGEAAFAKGDWQQAIEAYSRAWNIDHSSAAALYLGDTYFVMKDMDRAGEWFAKAIELEPNSETAYRYWADALMAQGKMREARAKYIEGVVADPYQATSIAGLRKWLAANKLAFKKIPITLPAGPSSDSTGKTGIKVDAATLAKPDVGAAWLMYSFTRVAWRNGKFLKAFPDEKSYRHSLAEEAAALKNVVQVYREPPAGKPPSQDAALELLAKFEDEGLLEPFVLLTHADVGIVKDYPSYRAAHRDNLNAFLDKYLVPPAPGTLDPAAVALDPPIVKVGDTWIYRATIERGPSVRNQTEEEIRVTRVTPMAIFVAGKLASSTQPPKEILLGPDWSLARAVNGKDTVVNRPLAFPLSDGKSWDVVYTEQNPNKNHKSEKFNSHFLVVGYESVEVPAGKFRALKIESEGHWEAQLVSGQSVGQGAQTGQGSATTATQMQSTEERQTSGRLYKAYWYVPEVKRWVKSVEEAYSSKGVRSERYLEELESFKPDENSAR